MNDNENEYQLLESSPKAKYKAIRYLQNKGIDLNEFKAGTLKENFNNKKPWQFLSVGESFKEEIATTNESYLRSDAANKSKKLNKIFIVIKHSEFGLFEVARIA